MKVLLINSLYDPNHVGGAERSTQLLAEGLVKAGAHPIVISTAQKDSEGTVNGVKVHYVKIFNLYWVRNAKSAPAIKKPLWHLLDADNPTVPARLRPIIAREKPDLIHTGNLTGFSPSVWRVARQAGIPIVHTIRDMYLGCVRSAMFRKGKICESQCLSCRFYSLPKRRLSRYVVGISNYILKWHLDNGYFSRAKVEQCIFNSVATGGTRLNGADPHRQVTFGFVGAIAPHKGIELLLRTVVDMKGADLRVKIFGRPLQAGYDSFLREKYGDNRIEFCGHKDPEEIFSAIDVNVVPSLCHEAFGRVVPEGYSYGVPAIVSNRGGLPETVDENATGTVFDPDIPGDLRDRISRFAQHPELVEQMRGACLNRVELYSQQNIVAKYLDLYERLLP